MKQLLWECDCLQPFLVDFEFLENKTKRQIVITKKYFILACIVKIVIYKILFFLLTLTCSSVNFSRISNHKNNKQEKKPCLHHRGCYTNESCETKMFDYILFHFDVFHLQPDIHFLWNTIHTQNLWRHRTVLVIYSKVLLDLHEVLYNDKFKFIPVKLK